jgi:DNA-binding HxlR family transcriptional regulator
MKKDIAGQPPDTLATKLTRGDVFEAKCPSREVLNDITSRWGVLVLVALLGGTHRFSDLRRKVNGVSEKMLAQTLRSLEGNGFVERIAYPVVPPHVEYTLTRLGRDIGEKVEVLADWIEVHLPEILVAKAKQPIKTTGASRIVQEGPVARPNTRAVTRQHD